MPRPAPAPHPGDAGRPAPLHDGHGGHLQRLRGEAREPRGHPQRAVTSASNLYVSGRSLDAPPTSGELKQKGSDMTNSRNDQSNQNHGNATTVHNPKAPGQIEKVDPETGDTTTESTNVEKPVNR